MPKPLVTVVIPNYNYSKYVAEAIESALAQTYENIEIIVVDDGSKDDSLDILNGYGSRIRVLKQRNQGVSLARNNGASNGKGEFIAFLDADDKWRPEKIAKQVERFRSDQKLGLVSTGVENIDADGDRISIQLDGMEGQVARELLLLKRPVLLGGGSGMMVYRNVFNEVGGFDRHLSTSADWEFCYRVAVRYRFGLVAEPLVFYRIHNSNMHNNLEAMEHDVLIGFEKAFTDKSADVQNIRAECYANFHSMLAGSYFSSNNYPAFIKHAAKSLWYKPQNIGYYLNFPLRRLKKPQ